MKKSAVLNPNAPKNSSYGHLLLYFKKLNKKPLFKTVTIYSGKDLKIISTRGNKTRENDLSFAFFGIKKY